MKIGIFGGSFNPPHIGHLNSLVTVTRKAGLDKVFIVPSHQSPLKVPVEGPSVEQRLELVQQAATALGDKYEVSDIEIKRGGKSFTIDTILALKKKFPDDEFFLIVGLDQFEQFSDWKNPKKILQEAHLIVTSRPGHHFPDQIEDYPSVIAEEVLEKDFNFIELKTGKNIQYIKLEDVDISSSQLRKWLRNGRNVSKYIPLSVESLIKEKNLYPASKEKIKDYKVFTEFCSRALNDKKAINLKALDLRGLEAPSEFALIASGTSTRHTSSLGENLIKTVKEEFNLYPLSLEGIDEGRWVVVDYGALMIHVFYDFVRQEYALEKLWKNAKDLELKL
jgi:nicotinate-nucleotide adenylyltransferase